MGGLMIGMGLIPIVIRADEDPIRRHFDHVKAVIEGPVYTVNVESEEIVSDSDYLFNRLRYFYTSRFERGYFVVEGDCFRRPRQLPQRIVNTLSLASDQALCLAREYAEEIAQVSQEGRTLEVVDTTTSEGRDRWTEILSDSA